MRAIMLGVGRLLILNTQDCACRRMYKNDFILYTFNRITCNGETVPVHILKAKKIYT